MEKTVWLYGHDFTTYQEGYGWRNLHIVEYEYSCDEYGNPNKGTGRSRIVPKRH